MSFRPKKRTNIGGVSGNQKGTKPAMLSITLKHGDMMVMHGAHIQRLYEVRPLLAPFRCLETDLCLFISTKSYPTENFDSC